MKNSVLSIMLSLVFLAAASSSAPGRQAGRAHPDDFLYKSETPPGSPLADNEVSIRWFGTAAFRLEYQNVVLWIDPYFSRIGFTTFAANKKISPKTERVDRYMDRADYIVIGHTHFDHASDLPYIVPKTGAKVVGSISTANLLRAYKIPESQIQTVTGGDSVELGPYKVTFVRGEHGKIFGKLRLNFDIPEGAETPLKVKDYGCGEFLGVIVEVAGHKIYQQGSTGIVEETLRDVRADILLLSLISRGATEKFVYRVVKTVQPEILIPMHFEWYFKPLSKGLTLMPGVKFGEAVAEALEAKPDVKIVTLPFFGEYRTKAR